MSGSDQSATTFNPNVLMRNTQKDQPMQGNDNQAGGTQMKSPAQGDEKQSQVSTVAETDNTNSA